MKRILTLVAAMATAAAMGQPYAWNSTNTVNSVIPDNDPSGYASTITVPVLSAAISNVTVTLDITGGYNGDLYAYLSGPNGGFAVLLDRVGETNGNAGGFSDAGFDVTLDDSAANPDIHNYQNESPTYSAGPGSQLLGTWGSDGESTAPNASPSSFTGVPTETLASFDNLSGDGTWTLFLADLAAGDQSTIVSWSLDITTVPEPQTWAMAGIGLAALWQFRRKRKS
jgi:subtilisin-like proprotein convertase family protein